MSHGATTRPTHNNAGILSSKVNSITSSTTSRLPRDVFASQGSMQHACPDAHQSRSKSGENKSGLEATGHISGCIGDTLLPLSRARPDRVVQVNLTGLIICTRVQTLDERANKIFALLLRVRLVHGVVVGFDVFTVLVVPAVKVLGVQVFVTLASNLVEHRTHGGDAFDLFVITVTVTVLVGFFTKVVLILHVVLQKRIKTG